MDTRLIIGLGNPGQQYADTRHNAGFLLVDRLIERFNAQEVAATRAYILWKAERGQHTLYLMKPLTYMNLSGMALADFFSQQPLALSQIMVAYDDVALDLGQLRIRPSGSAGGQKGMKHIIEVLNTNVFPRLRIGINSPLRGDLSLPDFVLGTFTDEEVPPLRQALHNAAEAVEMWLVEDFSVVMGCFNKRPASEPVVTKVSVETEENVD